MICNRTEDGWEIIYQRAHAYLGVQLVEHWKTSERPKRWAATLGAVLEHDNGWQDWEPGDRLTSIRTPRDFTETPVSDLVAQSERAIIRSWHQSLWEGLLVSRHVEHLYRSLRSDEPAIDDLLQRQTRQRREWRKQLKVKKTEVDAAYPLVLFADTFSLILCRRRLPFDGRALEIGRGTDQTRYDVIERPDGTVCVEPWPYEIEAFEVEVDSYRLDQLTFESADELSQALKEAPVRSMRWQLVNS